MSQNQIVSAKELLDMYKALKAEHKELKNTHNELMKVHYTTREFLNAKLEGAQQIIESQRKKIDELSNTVLAMQTVQKAKRYAANANLSGPEKIGSLDDYEYTSDGKRMCFINYITGNVVYPRDRLFDTLKRIMISGRDEYDSK